MQSANSVTAQSASCQEAALCYFQKHKFSSANYCQETGIFLISNETTKEKGFACLREFLFPPFKMNLTGSVTKEEH